MTETQERTETQEPELAAEARRIATRDQMRDVVSSWEMYWNDTFEHLARRAAVRGYMAAYEKAVGRVPDMAPVVGYGLPSYRYPSVPEDTVAMEEITVTVDLVFRVELDDDDVLGVVEAADKVHEAEVRGTVYAEIAAETLVETETLAGGCGCDEISAHDEATNAISDMPTARVLNFGVRSCSSDYCRNQ